jgi:hypothetical protein
VRLTLRLTATMVLTAHLVVATFTLWHWSITG